MAMDLKAMFAELEAKTGKTAGELAAALSGRAGVTTKQAEDMFAALGQRLESGVADASQVVEELAARGGVGVEKATALFEALKSDYEAKGLSGMVADLKAKLDTDGDGSILDDLKDAASSLLGRKDPSA
jgi:uncharacterized membrane protein